MEWNDIAGQGKEWNEMKWKTCANILSLFCQFLSSSSCFCFSLALSLPFVTCLLWPSSSLSFSLHLSLSHLLSSFNSWCTFCDIILNPAALLCIYISVCLGMQKVSHRLYLALCQSPHLSSPPNTVVIGLYRFFDTNSGSTVLFVVFFICLCLCNCCGE